MWNELVLRFEISPSGAKSLKHQAWLTELAESPTGSEKRRFIYFDSDKEELRKNGLSLHLERVGDNWLQSIETGGPGAGKWRPIREWKMNLKDPDPDLAPVPKIFLKSRTRKKLAGLLKPVFETDIRRTVLSLYWRDEHVELAIDLGRIGRGDGFDPVSGIEVKLKGGEASELAQFVERLSGDLGLRWESRSYAERGYDLGVDRQGKPAAAEEVVLERGADAQESFRAIALSCLRHLMLNEEAVRRGEAEGIHQMRVALRRLRSAISLYKNMLQDPQSEQVKLQLKWLSEQLGPARDMDVFVKETVLPLQQSQPPGRGSKLATLKAVLKARRAAGVEKARLALKGEHYRRILLETLLWLEAGAWKQDRDPQRQVERQRRANAYSSDVLTSRRKKIIRKIRKLDRLDIGQRHKLRIAVKKLRYATEFYQSLFPGKKAAKQCKAFRKSLKRLQRTLGKLNDIAVHERLADEIVPPPGTGVARRTAFAMGFVTGQERAWIDPLVATAVKAGRCLKKQPSFWK
jgi:inorganic triphosphatase YgiF